MNWLQELAHSANNLISVQLNTSILNPSYNRYDDKSLMFEDFLLSTSRDNSVQYYSQDPFENLKIKVTLRNVRSFSKASENSGANVQEDYYEPDEEQEDSFIVAWQQKVFSPREVIKYYNMKEPDTVLEKQYKREVLKLEDEVSSQNTSNPRLLPYKTSKNWGSQGLLDLVNHKLSTILDAEGQYTDTIHEPIACNTRTKYDLNSGNKNKIYRQLLKKEEERVMKRKSQRPQRMYIIANIGKVIKNNDAVEDWEGCEYVLCIIKAMPDGSFIMKPGLSIIPNDDDYHELNSKILKKLRKQEQLLKKKHEKKHIFRTEGGELFEYTVNIHNDFYKDPNIDKQRKDIIRKLNERSLMLRRNLVGQEFEDPPINASDIRIHVLGEIVSATDFDTNIYVKYFLHVPPGYQLNGHSRVVSATQTSTPVTKENLHGNYSYCSFGFPFEFHMSSSKAFPLPKMYFEVISKDFWERRRVVGYGYTTIPTTAGDYNLKVTTWKPAGSIRESMKSFFLGGSPELEDISYTGIPKNFKHKFLNKFGFITETSGTIKLKFQVIIQSSLVHPLWKHSDDEVSVLKKISILDDSIPE